MSTFSPGQKAAFEEFCRVSDNYEKDQARKQIRDAAPDLLEALKDILGMAQAHCNRVKAMRHNKGKPVIEAMEADLARARAAIAKAEGTS